MTFLNICNTSYQAWWPFPHTTQVTKLDALSLYNTGYLQSTNPDALVLMQHRLPNLMTFFLYLQYKLPNCMPFLLYNTGYWSWCPFPYTTQAAKLDNLSPVQHMEAIKFDDLSPIQHKLPILLPLFLYNKSYQAWWPFSCIYNTIYQSWCPIYYINIQPFPI